MALPQDVRADTLGDLGRRRSDRLPREMGVARRRLDLVVAEKLPDHRQAFADRERPRGERMAKIVKPDVVETGVPADAVLAHVYRQEPRLRKKSAQFLRYSHVTD